MKEKDWGSVRFGKRTIKTQTLIFACGLAGIVFIGLGPILAKTDGEEAPQQLLAETQRSTAAYAQELEDSLCQILSQVDGVGTVQVLVTLKNGYRYEYAKSAKVNNDILEDVQAEDSRKTQEKQVTEEDYVLVEGADGKEPLITMELEPEIKGVVVVCQGGDDPVVVGKVVETVTVAFDISSAQITVSKLAQTQ